MSKSSEADVRAVFVVQSSVDSAADPHLSDVALRRLERAFPGVPLYSNRPLRHTGELKGEFYDCLRQVRSRALDLAQDSVAVCWDLYPLLDSDLIREIHERHFRYLAQYSFAENTPPGLAPDFVSAEFIDLLPENPGLDLREYVLKNINEIDVELVYRLPDLRQFRMDLSTGSARSRRTAAALLAVKSDAVYADLEAVLAAHPRLLRPFPSYFEIELTTQSPAAPLFAPQPRQPRAAAELAVGQLRILFSDLGDHGLMADAAVCFGGQGDPLLHPEWPRAVALALESPAIHTVFIETYGTELTPDAVRLLAGIRGAERVNIILRLTTLRPDRARRLYGADFLPLVLSNIEALESLSPAERPFAVYAEMLKIKDVEDEIQTFFDRFEASPCVRPLLNKFNSYIGRVEERRVSDLTPLVRDYCRHLARDLYITAEGRIPLCKQDPFAEGEFTAVLSSEFRVSDFLERTADYHAASMRGEHEAIPMNCLGCDEWFTYNA